MDIGASIVELTRAVTKEWCRQRKAEERQFTISFNRKAALLRSCRVTLKDSVFRVMEEAITGASGGGQVVFPKRNLFYAARKLIQPHTSEQLNWKYFEGLVKDWEKEHGSITGMYCDPRGYFIEPHTG